jgi:hypothetical protein
MDATMIATDCHHATEFLPPPDWRWLTACALHSLPRRRRRRPGDPMWLASLLELAESVYPDGRKRRGRRSPLRPELLRAFELYQACDPLRWEVDARILAGQSDEEVAAATVIPADAVAAYEHAFFDVRRRLEAEDYIFAVAIGRSNFGGHDESDLKGLWAHFGYSAGPRMLELVMAVSLGRPLPEWALREAPSAADAELLRLRIRAMLIAQTGPLTPAKLRKLKVLHSQIEELKQKSPANGMKELVQACVLGAPELFGEGSDRPAPPSEGFQEAKSEVSRPSHADVA